MLPTESAGNCQATWRTYQQALCREIISDCTLLEGGEIFSSSAVEWSFYRCWGTPLNDSEKVFTPLVNKLSTECKNQKALE